MGFPDAAKIGMDHFLKRCGSCGAFRGEVAMQGQERLMRILCRCEGGKCPRCRRPLVQTPRSRAYSETGGTVWHQPMIETSCRNCGILG